MDFVDVWGVGKGMQLSAAEVLLVFQSQPEGKRTNMAEPEVEAYSAFSAEVVGLDGETSMVIEQYGYAINLICDVGFARDID